MVIDTSVLAAVLFGEAHGQWAAASLEEHAGTLRMSTVNLTELLILLRDRQPRLFDELEDRVLSCGIAFVPPDTEQARLAAEARLRYPMNLGDCFAYALAKVSREPVLTLDRDFLGADVEIVGPF
jgi:ribonuclease VapC